MVRVNATSAGQNTSVAIIPPQSYYDGLSKQWAVSESMINGEDYSSKYYAQESKKQAEKATEQAQSTSTRVEEINNATSTALNDIENKRSTAITEIATKQEQAIENVGNAQITAETSIQDLQTNVENTITTGIASVNTAKNTAISNVNTSAETQIANIRQEGATQVSNIKQTGFYMERDKLYYIDTEGNPQEFKQGGGGLELATIVCMPFGIDESENKYRYLNGQVIIQSQFPSFTTKVKSWQTTRPNLFATEDNWQAEKTASKLGQCGRFVVDDSAGTIRLPLVININGLTDLANCGVVKDESLPNITGEFNAPTNDGNNSLNAKGSFGNTGKKIAVWWYNSNAYGINVADFDASRSSSTYQDSAPVQQEAIQYPYVIVVNTGVEEAERPINNYQVNNVYSYGMSQYYKGTMNNSSWLRSAGQWNPGTKYTGIYNWAVAQQAAGVDGFVLSTETYTDYDWVINAEEQTFRLPLLDGSESIFSSNSNDHKGTGDIIVTTTAQNVYTAKRNGIIYLTPQFDAGCTMFFLLNGTIIFSAGFNSTTYLQETIPVQLNRGDVLSLRVDQNSAKCFSSAFYEYIGNGNLYYYVGDVLQNSDLINIARMGEELVDIKSTPHIVETYVNGTSGYRIWSKDSTGYRYCEQWGRLYNHADVSNAITFLKQFKDTNYNILINHGITGYFSADIWGRHSDEPYNLSTTGFSVWTYSSDGANTIVWKVCGYLAD